MHTYTSKRMGILNVKWYQRVKKKNLILVAAINNPNDKAISKIMLSEVMVIY